MEAGRAVVFRQSKKRLGLLAGVGEGFVHIDPLAAAQGQLAELPMHLGVVGREHVETVAFRDKLLHALHQLHAVFLAPLGAGHAGKGRGDFSVSVFYLQFSAGSLFQPLGVVVGVELVQIVVNEANSFHRPSFLFYDDFLLCPMEGQRAYILQGQAASLFQVYGCVFRYLYNLC